MTGDSLTEREGKAFEETLSGILQGISICIDETCIHSALILLYSAIDSMAFLYMPEIQQDVTGKDFKDWVTHYIEPRSTLGCSAEELWAARCGLVHTQSAESQLTRGGVREVYYAWGNKKALPPDSSKKWVMIKVEILRDQLKKGLQSFFSDIDNQTQLRQRVAPRVRKMLTDLKHLENETAEP